MSAMSLLIYSKLSQDTGALALTHTVTLWGESVIEANILRFGCLKDLSCVNYLSNNLIARKLSPEPREGLDLISKGFK